MKTARIVVAFCAVVLSIASAVRGHTEILVGRNTANQLIAHMHFPPAVPIPRSIHAGFGGYATALIGFESVASDDPGEDLFTLSPLSNITVRLVASDVGAAVFDGFHSVQPGESMVFGAPSFDYHPLFSIPNPSAVNGQTFSLRFVLHDTTGLYTDSAEFTVTVTPACPGDFDLSGEVSVADIFEFLTGWFAGDLAADFDGQGGLQVQDVFGFINAWFVACP